MIPGEITRSRFHEAFHWSVFRFAVPIFDRVRPEKPGCVLRGEINRAGPDQVTQLPLSEGRTLVKCSAASAPNRVSLLSLRPNTAITEIVWHRSVSGFLVTFTTSPIDVMPGGRTEAQKLAALAGLNLVEDENHVARWVRDVGAWPVSGGKDQSADGAQ